MDNTAVLDIELFISIIDIYDYEKTLSVHSTLGLGAAVAILALITMIPASALAVSEMLDIDLVVDTTTLQLQDTDGNGQPDAGETAVVRGKLYENGTQNEIGTYRCSMVWGGWANSTEGIPVTIGTQVFDMQGNGTIVLIGDEPGMEAVGEAVAAAIGGGTGQFTGISGNSTMTAMPLEGTEWPIDVVFNIHRPAM